MSQVGTNDTTDTLINGAPSIFSLWRRWVEIEYAEGNYDETTNRLGKKQRAIEHRIIAAPAGSARQALVKTALLREYIRESDGGYYDHREVALLGSIEAEIMALQQRLFAAETEVYRIAKYGDVAGAAAGDAGQ